MKYQQQLVQDLFLLQRVAQKLNRNLDIDDLLTEIVDDVSQTFGCSRLAVLLKDETTNELVVGADCGGDFNRHIKGERFSVGEYGMTGHVGATGETYYAPDVSVDPYYKVSDSLTQSEVDIPLRSQGRLIGVLNAQSKELDGFPKARIELLEALAGHIATAIDNARLFQAERREKERMAEELREAQRIQQALFPGNDPAVSHFVVHGQCVPCREVGGDWYDYIPLSDGRLGIVLADVSGKGLGAALLMSSTRTVMRLVAESGRSPGQVLEQVNKILLKDFPSTKFVTMVYALLDPMKGVLTFSNAGHPPPIFTRHGETHLLETDSGIPLGIEGGQYSERSLSFDAHERLVFYSDGATEAMNASQEQFGIDRLRASLAKSTPTVTSMLDDVQAFVAGQPATDDITIVVVERCEDSRQ